MTTTTITIAAAALLAAFSISAGADHLDDDSVPAGKVSALALYLTAREAYERKQGDPSVLLVDIRSNAEVAFLGMPTVADANVPYMQLSETLEWDEKRSTLKLESNPHFAPAIARLFDARGYARDRPLILICRSGKRSARAANLLAALGYTRVYSVVDGFEGDPARSGPDRGHRVINGWKNEGLPWSYTLDRERVLRVGWFR